MRLEYVQDVALVLFVLIVMTTDWRAHRIPNVATYPAMLIGLVLAALVAFPGELGANGLLDHLAALVAAFVLTAPLYATGGLKAGDVKLLMAVGSLKGLTFLFSAALLGALFGGAFAVGYIVVQRLARGREMREILRTFIPYGVALGLGALVALAVGVGG